MAERRQHDAWASGQAADAYFTRNRSVLDADMKPSKSTVLYASHLRTGDRLLEIGAANGRISEQLRRLTGCEAHGMDPSAAAIDDGRNRYPEVHLSVGTADSIPYPDEHFQAVLFGFCLYLVDRALLMRTVAEADRVLRPAGRLMITDFDPPTAHRRPFRHQDGVWCYKMQYPQLWLANPQYALADKVSFSHHGEEYHEDPNERVASWVLVKQAEPGYPVEP